MDGLIVALGEASFGILNLKLLRDDLYNIFQIGLYDFNNLVGVNRLSKVWT